MNIPDLSKALAKLHQSPFFQNLISFNHKFESLIMEGIPTKTDNLLSPNFAREHPKYIPYRIISIQIIIGIPEPRKRCSY